MGVSACRRRARARARARAARGLCRNGLLDLAPEGLDDGSQAIYCLECVKEATRPVGDRRTYGPGSADGSKGEVSKSSVVVWNEG